MINRNSIDSGGMMIMVQIELKLIITIVDISCKTLLNCTKKDKLHYKWEGAFIRNSKVVAKEIAWTIVGAWTHEDLGNKGYESTSAVELIREIKMTPLIM